MVSLFDIIALLIGLTALFGWINHRFLKLPPMIGLMIIALLVSIAIIILDQIIPQWAIKETVTGVIKNIDFHATLMNGILSLLLFAGALHVNLSELVNRAWAIGLMATIGVVISTSLIGTTIWIICHIISIPLPFSWALVFGALISPTDPVAVLGILKTVQLPRLLEVKIAGESLFNDGVGVVIFTILVSLALSTGNSIDTLEIISLFLGEALGGGVLGFVTGYLTYAVMRHVDDYHLEIIFTLALVLCSYAIALHLHLSGPIAVVIAGLFIGNHGAQFAMSEKTRQHVFQFWELSDEILNSVLFLLIGFEVLIITDTSLSMIWGLIAIPVVIIARWIAVGIPISLLAMRKEFTPGAITILTWGGLRGGISVALALSLPESDYKSFILIATYAVVIFSVIIQGLTVGYVARRFIRHNPYQQ